MSRTHWWSSDPVRRPHSSRRFTGARQVGTNGAPQHPRQRYGSIREGEGGHLHYISEQNFSPNVYDFTLKRAHVARDAEIDWVLGMFGASFQRYDVECVMEGEGGNSFMYAVGVLDHHQQFGRVHEAAPQDRATRPAI